VSTAAKPVHRWTSRSKRRPCLPQRVRCASIKVGSRPGTSCRAGRA